MRKRIYPNTEAYWEYQDYLEDLRKEEIIQAEETRLENEEEANPCPLKD